MIEAKDNFLPEMHHKEIFVLVASKPFRQRELDIPNQPPSEMTHSYDFQDAEREFILERILPKFPLNGLTPVRVYANAFFFGDTPRFHDDSKKPGDKTILYYPNQNWQPHWGAETLFVPDGKENNGVLTAVCPVPNRAIIFDSTMLHSARPPVYQGMVRYSVAIKLEK